MLFSKNKVKWKNVQECVKEDKIGQMGLPPDVAGQERQKDRRQQCLL